MKFLSALAATLFDRASVLKVGSTTKPTNVTEGDLTATRLFLGASQLEHNADPAAHGSAWTSFTPVVEQDSGSSVTVTVTSARYRQLGKVVHFEVVLNVTGAGNANNPIITTLPPITPYADWSTNPQYCGQGILTDVSLNLQYPFFAQIISTTAYRLRPVVSGMSTAGQIWLGGIQFTAALASGDDIRCSGTYEAA